MVFAGLSLHYTLYNLIQALARFRTDKNLADSKNFDIEITKQIYELYRKNVRTEVKYLKAKCECWHETPNRNLLDAECWGTRERDACSCGGDQMKCDFYLKIREKAAGEKFWHDAKKESPKQDGRYLVLYNLLGDMRAKVFDYALDLAETNLIDFENKHRSGWYDYDSEYGYFERNDVLYWADIPTAPMMTAKSDPDIQAAIAYYNKGINEDIFSPEVAGYAHLAVEALRKMDKDSTDLSEWPPEPEMEVIQEGFDLPLPIAIAPAIALVVCAVLRQMLL